ncbi:MAG: cellulose biosynthesis cyclic di-GMP-binding regulatory protein BcsB [Candidatus Dactylopiibacterium sp.]|nr:cellulose biosynthesis cyclic di-GMP-binding regulatory protein BcsB [Candidatus Dactylopiibacterium sp.]
MRFVLALILMLSALAAGAETITRRLADLGAPEGGIRLQGADARFTIKIPKAPREALGDAVLRLEMANSTALIRSRSALNVRLDGKLVASRLLDPEQPRFSWEIRIPGELLKTGYNDLTLNAVQHYTHQCEDAGSSELWSEIDTTRSTFGVEVRAGVPNAAPRLTQLPLIFDARQWRERPVRFVFGGDNIEPAAVTAAAYAAQGLALMRNRQPYVLSVHAASTAAGKSDSPQLPGLDGKLAEDADLILVGTRPDLARYLGQATTEMIEGPFLGVLPLLGGRSQAIVISGRNRDELIQAAQGFALPQFKHTDAPFEAVEQVPALPPAFALEMGKLSDFSRLGYQTQSRYGLDVTPFGVEFRVPGQLLGSKSSTMKVSLHFSYGAGMRTDSVLNVKVNGAFVSAISLASQEGAEFRDFRLEVPTSVLTPGMNVLHLEPVLMGHKTACDNFRPEQLVVTVFEDSTLELPRRSASPPLPDLARFARTAWPDDQTLRYQLLDLDPLSVAGTLNFFAGMAAFQQRIVPLQDVGAVASLESVLLIGTQKKMQAQGFEQVLKRSYNWQAAGNSVGLMQTVIDKRAITALVGATPEVLARGTEQLNRKGWWGMLAGAASIIDADAATLAVEPAQRLEHIRAESELGSLFSTWQALVLGALVLSVIVAALLVFLVRRKAQHRLK